MLDKLKELNVITDRNTLSKRASYLVEVYQLQDEVVIATSFMPLGTPINIRLKLIKDGITAQPICKNPSCNKCTQYKIAKSKFDDYCSLECYRTDPEGYKKQQGVMLERYGATNAQQVQEFADKRKQTILEEYGVDHIMKLDEFKQKVLNTKESKDPGRKKAMEKTRFTNIKKYGTSTYAESLIPLNTRELMMDKEWIIQNWVIQYKPLSVIAEELGISATTFYRHIHSHNINRDQLRYDILNKLKTIHNGDYSLFKSKEWLSEMICNQGWGINDIAYIIGCSSGSVRKHTTEFGIVSINKKSRGVSSYELGIRDVINKNYTGPIRYNDKTVIYPQEIDIYLPELNLGIEVNGITYHSECIGGKDRSYHLSKHNKCEQLGIHLVQIWGCEWENNQDIVKSRLISLLGKNKVIHARKCSVVELSNQQSKEFFESNHLQGYTIQSVCYGLVFDGNIVAAMSFGTNRFGGDEQYELLRYCNVVYHNVIGGAGKLFKHFVKQFDPEGVISYSTVRWNTGNLYTNLGFELISRSAPGYYYFHTNNANKIFHRVQFQKHKLESKLESFDPNLTEFQNMINNGFDRIWDCGNDVFVWKKNP